MEQLGFYFDQTRCIGCCTCIIACQDWHNDVTDNMSRRRMLTIEKGRFPDVSVSFMLVWCYHCARPSCMDVCPVEAVSKDDNGIVLVDRTACLGRDSCGLCLEACPYDVPQFGAEDDIGMEKCDFCYDRLAEGKKPICVESCPMHALDVGYMGEITARYGKFGEVEGFTYIRPCAPSIVINPKKKVTR